MPKGPKAGARARAARKVVLAAVIPIAAATPALANAPAKKSPAKKAPPIQALVACEKTNAPYFCP